MGLIVLESYTRAFNAKLPTVTLSNKNRLVLIRGAAGYDTCTASPLGLLTPALYIPSVEELSYAGLRGAL